MAETTEPWLRGTLMEVDPVRRGVLHALLLAREDVVRWAAGLALEELEDGRLGCRRSGFRCGIWCVALTGC